MEQLTAVGIHVFAGGFTRGVLDAGWKVPVQLEVHGFGLETTEAMNGVPSINCSAADWPDVPGVMSYGNPRCTAFSTITSGDRYVQGNTHGAFAKQTCDIQELCKYSAGRYDFVIWESVQQAYKASGRDLVRWAVRDVFEPKGYRIAHLLLNAASFGNSQQRKRYFFVAYRDCYKFNVEPPTISPHYMTLYDSIYSQRDRQTRPHKLWADADYDQDCYVDLTTDEWQAVPKLPNGWGLQTMAKHAYGDLSEKHKKKWDERISDLPFSLHGIYRLNWLRPCPTLHSSAGRFIHPEHHRPLTVGELSSVMGWPRIPVGLKPIAQIAKGVVPSTGKWLARQVELSYRHHWGRDDFESNYDDQRHEWVGQDASGKLEKEFDMTRYVGKFLDADKYDDVVKQMHKFNVCPTSGRLINAWKEIASTYNEHA